MNLYPSEKLRFKSTFYHQIVDNAISQYETDSQLTAFENIDDGLVMSGVETEFARTTEKGFCRGFATITNHRFGRLYLELLSLVQDYNLEEQLKKLLLM